MKHNYILLKVTPVIEFCGASFSWTYYARLYLDTGLLRICNWRYRVDATANGHFFVAGKLDRNEYSQYSSVDIYDLLIEKLLKLDAPAINKLQFDGTLIDCRVDALSEGKPGWYQCQYIQMLPGGKSIFFDRFDVSYTCKIEG